MNATSRRKLAVVALTSALVPLAAVPSTADDGPEQLGPGFSSTPASVEHRADAPEPTATPDEFTALSSAEVSRSDRYNDYCSDADPGGLDLFQLNIVDRAESDGTLAVRITFCDGVDVDDLEGGVLVSLQTSELDDYVLDFWAEDGRVQFGVWDANGDDGGFYRFTRVVPFDDGDDSVTGSFPVEELGDPDGFVFEVLALAPDAATVVDSMPDAGEPAGLWPASCIIELERRSQTVVPAPGELDTALRAVRAAGLNPGAPSRSGRFEVVLADADDAPRLAALDGIAEVRPSNHYQRLDTADPVHTGPEAWWREQAQAPASTVSAAGIEIAVIDDGIDGTRPEFGGRVAAGHNAVAGAPIAAGADSSRGGHGNHVAGIAGASSPDLVGIASDATLRPYQAFRFDGCATDETVAEAIRRATDDGVDVINLSLGGHGDPDPDVLSAIAAAVDDGIAFVAAAGNTGQQETTAFPASHPEVIAVGATGPDGAVTGYSSRGDWLDLVAPGGGLPEHESGISSLAQRDGMVLHSGTSMAAPVVAGAAALYLAAGGNDLRADLTASATPLGDDRPSPDYGHGLLQIEDLLDRVDPGAVEPGEIRDIGRACASAPAGVFRDVAGDHPHGPGILCSAHWEVADGYDDGTYRPQNDVTRAQMASFITRLVERAGGSLPGSGGTTFPDAEGSVHTGAVERLAAAGIVEGYQDGTYRPQRAVTRAQMATFLVRTLEYLTGTDLPRAVAPFDDHVGFVHTAAIEKIATIGVTGGDRRGDYAPQRDVVRGQMGSFIARSIAYLVDTGRLSP